VNYDRSYFFSNRILVSLSEQVSELRFQLSQLIQTKSLGYRLLASISAGWAPLASTFPLIHRSNDLVHLKQTTVYTLHRQAELDKARMVGSIPDYHALADGMRATQEVLRMSHHPPLTSAGLQEQLQQLQQLKQQQQQSTQDLLQHLELRCSFKAYLALCHEPTVFLSKAAVSCNERRQQARIANCFATDDTVLEVNHNAAGAAPPNWPAASLAHM